VGWITEFSKEPRQARHVLLALLVCAFTNLAPCSAPGLFVVLAGKRVCREAENEMVSPENDLHVAVQGHYIVVSLAGTNYRVSSTENNRIALDSSRLTL
jgi:hypothetical protein